MSLTRENSEDGNLYLRPRPRKTFELGSTPSSPGSSSPSLIDSHASQTYSSTAPSTTDSSSVPASGSVTPARTRSILNLTSSTLYGIYQGTAFASEREESTTPFGNGSLTPIGESRHGSLDLGKSDIPDSVIMNGPNGKVRRRRSTIRPATYRPQSKKGFQGYFLPTVFRLGTLFAAGLLYGALVTHLHDRRDLAPVKVEGIKRASWLYLVYWGAMGVLLGEALPYLDRVFSSSQSEDEDEAISDETDTNYHTDNSSSPFTSQRSGGWNDVLRSVGIFIGIAFAIRKLPWQSTLQLSLTLALTNPAIWYLIDRSSSGFLLSTLVSISGTALLLGTNPHLVPTPRTGLPAVNPSSRFGSKFLSTESNSSIAGSKADTELVLGLWSQEQIGVATWIASVLFVSAVCFGNIGRRFAIAGSR